MQRIEHENGNVTYTTEEPVTKPKILWEEIIDLVDVDQDIVIFNGNISNYDRKFKNGEKIKLVIYKAD